MATAWCSTGASSRSPRATCITIAACLFVLLLGSLQSGSTELEGAERRRPVARTAPRWFPISTPEEQGMDAGLLAQAVEHFLDNRELYNIHSMTVVRNGHIVADVYFHPFPAGSIHVLASTSKVFTTTLIGIAIDKGDIAGVDERVIDFFPDREIANLDDWKRQLTIEHLLTMTSGLGLDDIEDSEGMQESSDWVQFALDLPMSHEPGTWWNYHQPTAFLLSAIISQATGTSLLEFAREHLFTPLGIRDPIWLATPGGHSMAFKGLGIAPHDLAKFGKLFLDEGVWNGRRIVSESWIETATTVQVPPSYGYMWHIYAEFPGAFVGGGGGGQRLVVSPDRNLVVALTGGGHAHEDVERIYLEALDSMIFPAVRADRPLPPNPAGVAALADATARAAASPYVPGLPDPLPGEAQLASGRSFEMESNPAEVVALTPTFVGEDELRLEILTTGQQTDDDHWTWAFGLDGGDRCIRGELGVPACGIGGWQADRSLELEIDQAGLYGWLRITLAFHDGGDGLSVIVEDLDRFDPGPTWTATGQAID
jgi:CubicO group peptidase (beta-lactamase class C family)